jgi:hypothetical protein
VRCHMDSLLTRGCLTSLGISTSWSGCCASSRSIPRKDPRKTPTSPPREGLTISHEARSWRQRRTSVADRDAKGGVLVCRSLRA